MRVRAVDAGAVDEIELVASRMRLTLVEVLGEEVGGGMYSMEWLIDRVRFHLDPARCVGEVFVAEDGDGLISGHTIVRIEQEPGGEIGLFSTIYVAPESRGRGVAQSLLARGEAWMIEHGMTEAATYTDPGNENLKRLFARRGYGVEAAGEEFVRLSKAIAPSIRPRRARSPSR